MGIQNELTRLTDEISGQATLIEQIKAALEGKGTGDGSSTPVDGYVKVRDWGEVETYIRDNAGNNQAKAMVVLTNLWMKHQNGTLSDYGPSYVLSLPAGDVDDAISGVYQYVELNFDGFFWNSETKDYIFDTSAYKIDTVSALLNYETCNLIVKDMGDNVISTIFSNGTVHPEYTAEYYVKLLEGTSTPDTPSTPIVEQATPEISVSADGLITATAIQIEGYVEAGTKSATKQLTTQAAQTITPGTADKTITAGRYLTGAQTVKGDANLMAENIKDGVSIFGVSGSLKSVDLSAGIISLIKSQGQSKTIESSLTGIPLNAICYISTTSPSFTGILDANVKSKTFGSSNDNVRAYDRSDNFMRFSAREDGGLTNASGTIWWYVP